MRWLERLLARRAELEARARTIHDTAATEDRELNEAEQAEVRGIIESLPGLDEQIAQAEDLAAREQRAAPARQPVAAALTPAVQVTRNEATYRPSGEFSYFRDMISARNGDGEARERLIRNASEAMESRDGTSTSATSMGSFIPPRWLLDETATLARVGRVLAPWIRPAGAPTSITETVPRVTTGSSVAGQAGDNAAVSETDIVTAQLSRTTVTVAGQQDVSIQSVDLGGGFVDQIIFADLRAAYEAELDRQILRGSGTNELLGINAVSSINTVTYTDATPTVPELYPKVADAIQQIHTNRKAPGEVIIMTPRRWAWIMSAVDSSGRPLAVPAGSFNAVARYGEVLAQGIVGEMQGLPVVTTASGATNLGGGTEDQIVVARTSDMYLREGAVQTRILSEVLSANLTVRFQLYAYVGLFAGRYPSGISTIGGTGLIAPTF